MRASWLGDGGQPVTPQQSHARASVCLPCPYNNANRPAWKFIAEVGSWELRHQIELKREMKLSTPMDDWIHVCDACGCLLTLKVHAPLKHILATTDLDALPSYCWIKVEKAEQESIP